MSLPLEKPEMREEDFLAGEPASEIKHEFVAGQVYAMAGASERHNTIALNVAFHLKAASRGSSCRAFISDMLLHVPANRAYYYPDVMLVCDPADTEPRFKSSPCLLIEVLSDSTEMIDRREKLLGYRKIPTLQHYLLVAQDQRRVECYSRYPEDSWRHQLIEDEGEVSLVCASRTLNLTLADIYEDVVFS
ncbi:MAG: Uma2 family endonuclease [Halothiobacillaceae bacterium]